MCRWGGACSGWLWLGGVLAVLLGCWLLWLVQYGFDVSLEGAELAAMAAPAVVPVGSSLAGVFYHPLYRLVAGDVVLLRQMAVIFTASFALFLVQQWLQHFVRIAWITPPQRWCIAGVFACGFMLFWRVWLPTPGMHMLLFQAMLLAAAGAALMLRGARVLPLGSGLLLGVALWMGLLAHVVTGALLAVVVWCCIFGGAGRQALRAVLLSVMVLLVLCVATAWVYRLDIAAYGAVLHFSVQRVVLFTWLRGGFEPPGLLLLRCAVLLLVAAGFAVCSAQWLWRALGAFVAAIFVLAAAGFAGGWLVLPLASTGFYPLLLLGAPWSLLLLAACFATGAVPLGPDRRAAAMLVLLLLLPDVFAYGVAGAARPVAALCGLFWLLAGVWCVRLLPRQRQNALMPVMAYVLLVAVAAVMAGLSEGAGPLSTLRAGSVPLRLGEGHLPLRVTEATASRVQEMRARASGAGFTPGMAVVDATGAEMAGWIYAMGGVPVQGITRRLPCGLPPDAWLLAPDIAGGTPPFYRLATRLVAGTGDAVRTFRLLRPISGKKPRFCAAAAKAEGG